MLSATTAVRGALRRAGAAAAGAGFPVRWSHTGNHAHGHGNHGPHGHALHKGHTYASPHTVDIPNVPLTDFVAERFSSFGDKPALVDGPTGHTISYSELPFRIGNVMKGLHERGFREGDAVCIHMPNTVFYPIIFHAIAAAGGVVTTSNPLYTATELKHQLRDAKAKFVVTVPPFEETAKAAAKEADVRDVFTLGAESGKFIMANDGVTRFHKTVALDPADHVVALPYSSGTTGLPKGVMLTHRNMVANVQQITAHPDLNVDLRADDRCLAILPAFHIYGMQFNINSCLRQGSAVVFLPKFDPPQFLEVMSKQRITFAPLVPPIIAFLARHPIVSKFDLSALRVIFSGAAPLDAETQKAVELRLPGVRSCQGYGMSETSPVTHIPHPQHVVPGAIGVPVANTSMKIVHPTTGEELPAGPDNVGELCIHGPQVMKGYLNNPTATASTLKRDVNGAVWLHTGDIAWRDADGQTRIVDRAKELIKCKGFQVAPAELEGLLLSHPGLSDAAVIGAPDERAGEVPVAFVVRKPAAAGGKPEDEVTAEAVREWMRPKVAEYKLPSAVIFIDAVPKSASGKILRRVLKDGLSKHLPPKAH